MAFQDKLSVNLSNIGIIKSKTLPMIDHFIIIKKWVLSPADVKKTVNRSTYYGACTALHHYLLRNFMMNYRSLLYNRLPHPVHTNTLEAGTK